MNMETGNFELIPDATDRTYIIDPVDYSDFGRYRCIATVELLNNITDISNDAIVHGNCHLQYAFLSVYTI